MLKNIKSTVMDGAKDGLSLYAASKAFKVADAFASSFAPIPELVRKPAVGILLATVLNKTVGGRIGKLATAVAFEQTIATLADPVVNPMLLSIAGGAAPATTQGYRITRGYSPSMRGGIPGRTVSLRGMTGVEA